MSTSRHEVVEEHPQRQSLREEQKELTRRRLTTAALEVFARDGYVAATIEQIAAAAGTSRATFYLHFHSKATLIHDLLDPLSEDSEAIYAELAALERPDRAQLRDWMERTVSFWERHGRSVEVVQQAVAAEPELVPRFVAAIDRSVDAMEHFLVATLRTDSRDARLTGELLILQLERFCFFWIVRQLDVPGERDAVIDTLTDVWMRTLRLDDTT